MIIPIPLQFSNAYLLKTGNNVILVDTGCKGHHTHILKAIEEAGVNPDTIRLILHTHVHADHCGSTVVLAKLLDVPTLIHRYEYESLHSGNARGLITHDLEGKILKPFILRWGVTFFEPTYQMDADTFSLNEFGVNATAYLTPGHTAGSISIVDHETDEAIIGDILMGGILFNMIRPSKPRFHFFIQDIQMIRWSLSRLLKLNLNRLHPGHGNPLAVKDIKQIFADFLT